MTQVDDQHDVEQALRGSLSTWSMAPGNVDDAVAVATGKAGRARRRRTLTVGAGATLTAAALIASVGLSQARPSSPNSVGSLKNSANPYDAPLAYPFHGVNPRGASKPVHAYEMKVTFARGTYNGMDWAAEGTQMDATIQLIDGMACQGFDGPDYISYLHQSVSDGTTRGLAGKIAGFTTGTGDKLIPALMNNKLACRWWLKGTTWPKPMTWSGHEDADHFLGEVPNGSSTSEFTENRIGKVAVLAAARVGDVLVLGVGYDQTKAAAQRSATQMVLATEQKVRASGFPPASGKPVPGSSKKHVYSIGSLDSKGPNDLPMSALPSTLLPHGDQLPRDYEYSSAKDSWTHVTTSQNVPSKKGGILAGTTDGQGWKNPPKGEVQPILGVGDLASDFDDSSKLSSTMYCIAQTAPGQAEQFLQQNIVGTGSRGFRATLSLTPWPGGSDKTHFLAKVTRTAEPEEGVFKPGRPSFVAAQVVGDYVVSSESYISTQQAVDGVNAMVSNLRTAGRVK